MKKTYRRAIGQLCLVAGVPTLDIGFSVCDARTTLNKQQWQMYNMLMK